MYKDLYIFDALGNHIIESDQIRWGEWYQTANRIIKTTVYPWQKKELKVSTVFLAIDDNFSEFGGPILYETMLFGCASLIATLAELSERYEKIGNGYTPEILERYSTRTEAEKGHQRMCTFIEVCLHRITQEIIQKENQAFNLNGNKLLNDVEREA